MQLTRHTDYALRLLIYLAKHPGERMAIATVAEHQNISRTHLMKIANQLTHAGFIEATRGRGGGIRLALAPSDINIGAVVAAMEPKCALIDCTGCQLIRNCSLPAVLSGAKAAFMAHLRQSNLAAIVT